MFNALRVVVAAPSAPRFTLPTTGPPASDKSGTLPLLRLAPAEVLDDPVGVADRVAAEDEQGDAILPGELVDLGAVRLAPRHAPLLDLDPVLAQLARHAPARAQVVRRRLAAVEDCGHGSNLVARPTIRQLNGWRRPLRAIRSPSRSSWKRTVDSTVSSCGRVVQPSSRRALADRYVHQCAAARTSDGVIGVGPGARVAVSASASAARSGSRTAGPSTPEKRSSSPNSRFHV